MQRRAGGETGSVAEEKKERNDTCDAVSRCMCVTVERGFGHFSSTTL